MPVEKNKIIPVVMDWGRLTEPEAMCELARRIGVTLRVHSDGTLKAGGNVQAVSYLSDIAGRYRGAIIAHLLGLPEPEAPDEQERENILLNAQALDVTITEYGAATKKPEAYLEKLLVVRRRMAAIYLVQNICAFRSWLYAAHNTVSPAAFKKSLFGRQ